MCEIFFVDDVYMCLCLSLLLCLFALQIRLKEGKKILVCFSVCRILLSLPLPLPSVSLCISAALQFQYLLWLFTHPELVNVLYICCEQASGWMAECVRAIVCLFVFIRIFVISTILELRLLLFTFWGEVFMFHPHKHSTDSGSSSCCAYSLHCCGCCFCPFYSTHGRA